MGCRVIRGSDIKDNLSDLYALYRQHTRLFDFWKTHKNIKSEEEILNRIEYISKNKIKQKNEIETLIWVLGNHGTKH